MINQDFYKYLKCVNEVRLNLDELQVEDSISKLQKYLLEWVYDNSDIFDCHCYIAWIILYSVIEGDITPFSDIDDIYEVIFDYFINNVNLYDKVKEISIPDIIYTIYNIMSKFNKYFITSHDMHIPLDIDDYDSN